MSNTTSSPSLPKSAQQTVPLQVLALGMPRTGTLSMRQALETLGYGPCMHGYEIADHPELAHAWIPLIRAKWEGQGPVTRDMLDAAVGKYASVTDVPCASFWEELIDLYPDAKVVLVERDFDTWYKSFNLVVDNVMGLPGDFTRYFLEPITRKPVVYVLQTCYSHQFWAKSPGGILANARAVYKDHYARIRRKVPKERLLDYKMGDGWEPLCKFLGNEVPGVDFPRVNDAEDFQRMINEKTKLWAWQAAGILVWPMILIIGLGLAWRLRGSVL